MVGGVHRVDDAAKEFMIIRNYLVLSRQSACDAVYGLDVDRSGFES